MMSVEADGTLLPIALVATTEMALPVNDDGKVTTMGDVKPVAVTPEGLAVTV
jgi:hypothetical protein